MNKREKIIIFIIILFICLFLLATTIAFITKSLTTNNVITFGNLKMELIQTTLNDKNQEIEITENDNLDITNNSKVIRIAKVKNLGKHSFYTRISLNMLGVDSNEQAIDMKKLYTYHINGQDWIYKDGWLYYTKKINENEQASNLNIEIDFDINQITNQYPKGKFKFNINAEVVQAENNENEILNVIGWPST